jgi:hypothetical protein
MLKSLSVLVAASLAVTLPAAAQTSALCTYVQKVLAAKASDFSSLKGAPRNPKLFNGEVFDGTLEAVPGEGCTLDVRHKAGRAEIPARYTCSLGSAKAFTDANRIFQQAARDLKACLPRMEFVVMYDGDGSKPDESFDWLVAGKQDGVDLQLEMSNGVALIAQSMGVEGAPDIAVTLDITNTTPPPDPI